MNSLELPASAVEFVATSEEFESFICHVDVCLSPTFYGWVFGFGGDIRILSPQNAVNEIIRMSKSVIEATAQGYYHE